MNYTGLNYHDCIEASHEARTAAIVQTATAKTDDFYHILSEGLLGATLTLRSDSKQLTLRLSGADLERAAKQPTSVLDLLQQVLFERVEKAEAEHRLAAEALNDWHEELAQSDEARVQQAAPHFVARQFPQRRPAASAVAA